MATREEIADILAGFTLFGDLQTPQLLGVASIFDEVVFPSGERILRQGLTGSGFYVILDGTADVRIDGRAARRRSDAATSSARSRSCWVSRRPPTSSPPPRSAASRSPAATSRASSSRTPRSCTGCSRPRRVDSATPTAGGADRGRRHASLPARGVPGHRHRQRSRRAPGVVRAQALRRPARRPVRGPVARRDVPPLAVLPAPPVVDQALRARGAGFARVPALRLEQPDRVRARAPVAPGRVHGRLVVLPVAARDGGQPRPAFADQAGIAVRYDCRWERTRRDDGPDGPTFTLETTDGEYRTRVLVLAVGVAEPWTPKHAGHRARAPLRRDARRVDVRRQAAVHHRQAELGLRARLGARGVGVEDHGRVAVARQDLGPDEVAGRRPGALRAAVRGQLPRPRGLDPRRLDRRDRATSARGSGSSSSGPTTGSR